MNWHKIRNKCIGYTQHELQDTNNDWLDICLKKNKFEEQVPLVLLCIQGTQAFTNQVSNICRDLCYTISLKYPNHKFEIFPFGSTLSGLNLKGSDLDAYIEFEFLPDTPAVLVTRLRNILSSNRRLFKQVRAIKAKTPIVKLVHVSGILCDLSFTNALGLRNTHLIHFLLDLDDRVKPLILILKFWAKKQGLILPYILSSYSLITLVVCYLQQLSEPILPTIHSLQVAAEEPLMVAGWNVAFIRNKHKIPPTKNKETLFQLLHGFFKFYSSFEFAFHVLCPFIGKPVLMSKFVNAEDLPSEFSIYKQNYEKKFEICKTVCVMDFFQHSSNITRNLTMNVITKLYETFGTALSLCEIEERMKNNKDHKSEFFKLFFKPYSTKKTSKRMKKETNCVINVGSHAYCDGTETSEDDIRMNWWSDILSIFIEILENVYKCSIIEHNYITEGERVLQCKVDHMLGGVNLRNTASREMTFPENVSPIVKEIMISDHLIETEFKNSEKFALKFSVSFVLRKQPTQISINFENCESVGMRKTALDNLLPTVALNVPKLIRSTFDFKPKVIENNEKSL